MRIRSTPSRSVIDRLREDLAQPRDLPPIDPAKAYDPHWRWQVFWTDWRGLETAGQVYNTAAAASKVQWAILLHVHRVAAARIQAVPVLGGARS